MLLRNHGIVACGSTVEEAYHHAINVTKACDIQVSRNLFPYSLLGKVVHYNMVCYCSGLNLTIKFCESQLLLFKNCN